MRPRLRWGAKPWYARVDRKWIAAGAVATATPGLIAVAVLAPRAAAHPDHGKAQPTASPAVQAFGSAEPSPPPLLDADQVAAAAKRAPASAPLQRLPQVDLNGLQVGGIPHAALRAYVTAARMANTQDGSCHIRWWLLGGIGLVESGHARSGGSAAPDWSGVAKPPIYGPRLDGSHGYGAIRDSDHGKFDRDTQWDRAVGPMQFLPSTWTRWGTDAKGHVLDPQDIRAAALGAGRYLCASSADLATPAGMASAVYSYNHSWAYVHLVLSVAARYAGIDPNALGVDRLPKDDAGNKAKKHKKKSTKASPKPSASSAPQPASSGSSPNPQQSPSPTQSSGSGSGSGSSPSSSPAPGGGLPTIVPTSSPLGFGG